MGQKKDNGTAIVFIIALFVLIVIAVITPIIIVLGYLYNSLHAKSIKEQLATNPALFWLDVQEQTEFKQISSQLSKAAYEIKSATHKALSAGISRNKDGAFSVRSNLGKEVRATLEQYQPEQDLLSEELDQLKSLPYQRWSDFNAYVTCEKAFLWSFYGWMATLVYAAISGGKSIGAVLMTYWALATNLFRAEASQLPVSDGDLGWVTLAAIITIGCFFLFRFIFRHAGEKFAPMPEDVTRQNISQFDTKPKKQGKSTKKPVKDSSMSETVPKAEVVAARSQKEANRAQNRTQGANEQRTSTKTKSTPQQTTPPASQPKDNNDYDIDEDDLIDFKISHGSTSTSTTSTPTQVSKNTTPALWCLPGQTKQVGEFTLTGGFFYFGGQTDNSSLINSDYDDQTEASLIDDSLAVINEGADYEDGSLGYWPSYDGLSPACRGAYLTWLASDRSDPDTPLGYVFVYFYGLERRILLDFTNENCDEQECKTIYREVHRLRKIYGENRSFYRYASGLMEYIRIAVLESVPDDGSIKLSHHSLLFKYRLATVVDAGEPISAELAMLWSQSDPNHQPRTPARRCAAEFKQLFAAHYATQFGEGLMVKANKTRFKLDYYPASGSLQGLDTVTLDLPDPSILTAPVKKLMALAEQCTDELDASSRYLGRGNSRDDLPGLLLLPEPLLNADTIPVLATFAQWAKQQIDTQSGLVTMVDFWSALGQPAPQSIYKKDLELITKLCEIVGLGLAPDPRFHHAKPAVDGQLVLFMPSHGDDFSPSAKFNEVAMMLRLGAMMAGVDGTVDEQETTLLHRLIDNNPQLSAIEKSSLHAYLLWRLNAPVNMNGLKARLAPLCDTGKSAVSHVLVRIALADGTVDPNEVRQLEKLYAALGLDKTSVSSDIHRISAARPTAQSPTIEAKPQKANPTKAQPADSPITFNLDEDKLALHESETREVQSMLGAIFTDDEPLNEAPPIPTAPLTAQLDGKHQQFYQHLLGKDLWSRDELQSYCAQSGLMLDGAIETINDWAYDIIDDPVLEDEGDILVDQQTAQDIADELAAEVAA